MPTAWTNGMTVLPDVLGGSTAKQIEAIWVYLSRRQQGRAAAGNQQALHPAGARQGGDHLPQLPRGRGPRAIGVGYPEKAHLAFDANELRLAHDLAGGISSTPRGTGPTAASASSRRWATTSCICLPGSASPCSPSADEAWPTKSATELGYKFHGYRLTADERPTFLYSCHGVRIEDFPNAVASVPNPVDPPHADTDRRKAVDNLWFRAAVADKIEPAGDKGWYRINGEWTMKIDAGAAPQVRKSGGKVELLVPVRFQDGKARIVQEFVW